MTANFMNENPRARLHVVSDDWQAKVDPMVDIGLPTRGNQTSQAW
jgi:hypothetical protein